MQTIQRYSRLVCTGARQCCIGLIVVLGLAGCAGLPFGAAPTPAPVIVIATPAPPSASTPAPAATAAAAPTEAPTTSGATAPAATVAGVTSAPNGGVLQRVRERGRLICGANADLPGFGFYDNVRNQWSGFDVDFCRAVAAAVLGDAEAVEFVGLTTSGPNERFAAIREGRVDVLFRNTTWTLGRDALVAFGPTTFHDGQTFMVRRSANVNAVDGLAGKTICVAQGTTSELNLIEDFAVRGIAFTPRPLEQNQIYVAYDEGECDAVTSDSSQLASKRETLTRPDDHVILGERISREPLGPAFIKGDDQWRDVVTWTVFATIYAEELRVGQNNVAQLAATSDDPRVRRLLGLEGDLGAGIGLPNNFARTIIEQVGNYGDIYDRNLGPRTPFALERGPNKVWNLGAGGVLAAPPFR